MCLNKEIRMNESIKKKKAAKERKRRLIIAGCRSVPSFLLVKCQYVIHRIREEGKKQRTTRKKRVERFS